MMTGVDDPFLLALLDELGMNCYESLSAFPVTSFKNLVASIDGNISKISDSGSAVKRLKQLNPRFNRDYKLSEKNICDVKEIHQAVHCSCLCGTDLEVTMKGFTQNPQ